MEILEPAKSTSALVISEDSFILRVRVPSQTTGTDIKVKILVNGEELHKQNIQPGIAIPIQIPLEKEGEYTVSAIAVSDGVESAPETRKITFRDLKPDRPNLIFSESALKGTGMLRPAFSLPTKMLST